MRITRVRLTVCHKCTDDGITRPRTVNRIDEDIDHVGGDRSGSNRSFEDNDDDDKTFEKSSRG